MHPFTQTSRRLRIRRFKKQEWRERIPSRCKERGTEEKDSYVVYIPTVSIYLLHIDYQDIC